MSGDLFESAVALLRQATDADQAGQVPRAIELYLLALDGLVKCHSYEKLEMNRMLLKKKISTYMERVELLKGLHRPIVPSAPLELPSVPSAPPTPIQSKPSPNRQSSDAPHVSLKAHTQKLESNSSGWDLDRLFSAYIRGAVRVTLEDPYLRHAHQLHNLVRLAELLAQTNDCYEFLVITRKDEGAENLQESAMDELRRSLQSHAGITFMWKFSETLHDRCLRLSNGWRIVLGRGLDMWQKPEIGFSRFFVGANDMRLRKTHESEIHFIKDNAVGGS